jgi:hypothetical protein
MTFRGRVKNGVIVLDPPASLPEGEEVEVVACPKKAETNPHLPDQSQTLYDVLRDVIGKAEGLPDDISVNHDHYLYGTPKH